ncbi:MAG: aminodeoxychorismate lyase [bacterium]|nr:aminodeoxychorismate lyase [bacterium]
MIYPVWINGSAGTCIDPADRGLAYGDGLFETLRIEHGRAIFLEQHLSRLFNSCHYLGIALDAEKLRQDFSRFRATCSASGIIKIMVTRGVSGRGYLPDPAAAPTVIFSSHALPLYPAAFAREGVTAALCVQRLGQQPMLAGHKHLNRLEQVMLRRELAEMGADEALVCDLDGNVVEGVFNNVFLVRAGVLCTPHIEMAGVLGVMRSVLIAQAKADGIQVQQGQYVLDDFLEADEVFFCNSVNGIWPVRCLHDRHWQSGPVTRQLQDYWQSSLSY